MIIMWVDEGCYLPIPIAIEFFGAFHVFLCSGEVFSKTSIVLYSHSGKWSNHIHVPGMSLIGSDAVPSEILWIFFYFSLQHIIVIWQFWCSGQKYFVKVTFHVCISNLVQIIVRNVRLFGKKLSFLSLTAVNFDLDSVYMTPDLDSIRLAIPRVQTGNSPSYPHSHHS